ncbi:MAG: hypothetical protein PVF77_02125 [Anaerolineae bacterium]
MQPGQRALILNAPVGYMEELGPLPDDIEFADLAEGECDFVHLFVKDSAEMERLGPVAVEAVKRDGLLWVSYPKRSSKVKTDLSRDKGWDILAQAGLRPVTQISVNEVWSALRWRPRELVGKKAG